MAIKYITHFKGNIKWEDITQGCHDTLIAWKVRIIYDNPDFSR